MPKVKACAFCGKMFELFAKFGTGRIRWCSIDCAAWSRIDRKSNSECWLWTGYVDATGYGQFGWRHSHYKPHRFVLAQKVGRDLVPEECCMHACDTPPCCNPRHLSIGTRGENILDAHHKGRLAPPPITKKGGGSFHFDESEIVAMRQRRAEGETILSIAQSLGLNRLTVANIVHRKTWKNVA